MLQKVVVSSPCVRVERLEPGADEQSQAVFFAESDEEATPRLHIRTFDPRSEDLERTDASAPETVDVVDVEVRADGADGALVLEETYEPDDLVHSRRGGDAASVSTGHGASVIVDLSE